VNKIIIIVKMLKDIEINPKKENKKKKDEKENNNNNNNSTNQSVVELIIDTVARIFIGDVLKIVLIEFFAIIAKKLFKWIKGNESYHFLDCFTSSGEDAYIEPYNVEKELIKDFNKHEKYFNPNNTETFHELRKGVSVRSRINLRGIVCGFDFMGSSGKDYLKEIRGKTIENGKNKKSNCISFYYYNLTTNSTIYSHSDRKKTEKEVVLKEGVKESLIKIVNNWKTSSSTPRIVIHFTGSVRNGKTTTYEWLASEYDLDVIKVKATAIKKLLSSSSGESEKELEDFNEKIYSPNTKGIVVFEEADKLFKRVFDGKLGDSYFDRVCEILDGKNPNIKDCICILTSNAPLMEKEDLRLTEKVNYIYEFTDFNEYQTRILFENNSVDYKDYYFKEGRNGQAYKTLIDQIKAGIDVNEENINKIMTKIPIKKNA